MSQITHNISLPNDGLGDALRNAFDHQNTMNTELYNDKVDKVTGKDLSSNDFTNALKDKLDNIDSNAEENVQSDWNQNDDTADDFIKNKPDALNPTLQEVVDNGGEVVDVPDGNYIVRINPLTGGFEVSSFEDGIGLSDGTQMSILKELWGVSNSLGAKIVNILLNNGEFKIRVIDGVNQSDFIITPPIATTTIALPAPSVNGAYTLATTDQIVAGLTGAVVANIAARNAYNVPSVPFSILVNNDGDSNWALYLATTTGVGATFIKVSDPDLLNAIMSNSAIKTAYESNADTNAFTNALLAKLNGIATAATSNSSDAFLLDRANHIGTQLAATISDFATGVWSAITDSAFGTFIIGLTAKATPIDADSIVISDSANSNKAKKSTFTQIKAFLKTYFDGIYVAKSDFVTTYLATADSQSTDTDIDLTGFTFNVAPGKEVVVDLLGAYVSAVTTTGIGLTWQVANPAGADGPIIGSYSLGVQVNTSTGTTGDVEQTGSTISVAANTTTDFSILGSQRTSGNNSLFGKLAIKNTSTNQTCTIKVRYRSEVNTSSVTIQAGTFMSIRTK